jgi:hypothetical protein
MITNSQLTADKFEETVINGIMRATPKLQRAVLNGELTDAMTVGDWIMQRAGELGRFLFHSIFINTVLRKMF